MAGKGLQAKSAQEMRLEDSVCGQAMTPWPRGGQPLKQLNLDDRAHRPRLGHGDDDAHDDRITIVCKCCCLPPPSFPHPREVFSRKRIKRPKSMGFRKRGQAGENKVGKRVSD